MVVVVGGVCVIRDDQYSKLSPLYMGAEQCESLYSCGPHIRMCWLIHFVVSGKGTYTVGDNVFTVSSGQAFLIKPGDVTTYIADKDEPWYYIWASFDLDSDILDGVPYVINDDYIRNIFTDINENFDFSSENHAFAISHIWNIYGRLIELTQTNENNSYIREAINIIKQQYMNDISVKSISDQLGLDRSYFCNLFKKHIDATPMQFIINYRMQKALKLLICQKYSVSVIAASVGYSDSSSFSKSFKKYYGVPPQRYKEIDPKKLSFTI